jgi:hypothetical protein
MGERRIICASDAANGAGQPTTEAREMKSLLAGGAIISLVSAAHPALAQGGTQYYCSGQDHGLSPGIQRQMCEMEQRREAETLARQKQYEEAQRQKEEQLRAIETDVGADTGCALHLLPCKAHAGEPDPCADSTLNTKMAMASPFYTKCLNWRLQRQQELETKMKADPLAFAHPWSKDDSADVKWNRYKDTIQSVSKLPLSQSVPRVNLLVRQGYADGEPKLKEYSDWVCQKTRETAGSRLEACEEHTAAERAKAEAAKQAWNRTAVGRVYNGYQHYAVVKYCHDVRDGYAVQYINEAEMSRAETAVRAIVNKAKAEDPTINTDQQWQSALKAAGRFMIPDTGGDALQSICQYQKYELFGMSPVAVYPIEKP